MHYLTVRAARARAPHGFDALPPYCRTPFGVLLLPATLARYYHRAPASPFITRRAQRCTRVRFGSLINAVSYLVRRRAGSLLYALRATGSTPPQQTSLPTAAGSHYRTRARPCCYFASIWFLYAMRAFSVHRFVPAALLRFAFCLDSLPACLPNCCGWIVLLGTYDLL